MGGLPTRVVLVGVGWVTLFLPCFVQTEGGGVSLSMGVLRISGGLWGGTAEGGGADNDPAPPA